MIGRIIMIGSLFRRKPAYTNRLACLIVINNAKGAHKTVTSPLRARVGWAQARGGVNCNLPIGNRETPMCVRVCGTLRFFLSFFSFFFAFLLFVLHIPRKLTSQRNARQRACNVSPPRYYYYYYYYFFYPLSSRLLTPLSSHSSPFTLTRRGLHGLARSATWSFVTHSDLA